MAMVVKYSPPKTILSDGMKCGSAEEINNVVKKGNSSNVNEIFTEFKDLVKQETTL